MAILLILGLAAIAGAIGLGVYVLAGQHTAIPAGDGMGALALEASGPRSDSSKAELPSLFARFGAIAGHLTPSDYGTRLQRRLDRAGNPKTWTPERVLGLKGIGLIAGAVLGLLFGAKHGTLVLVAAPVALAAFGFFIPDILVRNFGEKRQLDLQKGLPDALDMMTVSVEAGLGFDAAMSRVSRNLAGPIGQEFARVLQEMQFGMSRTEALQSLVERTDQPDLRRFVSAIVQSSELGISVGQVLREQAKEMRVLRRQRAEERAQKLQVKILLPLIMCLLPAMFVVILGPAVIQITHFFHSVN
jgi:tight adherence protein C